jgi:hypothetical protein
MPTMDDHTHTTAAHIDPEENPRFAASSTWPSHDPDLPAPAPQYDAQDDTQPAAHPPLDDRDPTTDLHILRIDSDARPRYRRAVTLAVIAVVVLAIAVSALRSPTPPATRPDTTHGKQGEIAAASKHRRAAQHRRARTRQVRPVYAGRSAARSHLDVLAAQEPCAAPCESISLPQAGGLSRFPAEAEFGSTGRTPEEDTELEFGFEN